MRKWFVTFLVAVPAALMPLAAAGQIAPDRAPSIDRNLPTYKYQVFAGASYTSLNQVNQSRYGLIGAEVTVTRNWGRFFGVTADGAYYPHSVEPGNPGSPSVDMLLLGPEVHGPIFEKFNVFAHALLGGEHTGGEGMTPNISFAGGAGAGLEYVASPRWVMRAWGDDIASSFSVINSTPNTGNSPHMRRNSRASVGIAYRF